MSEPNRPDVPPELPLFPLPSAVVFPNTQLPLHIFEPRYRELLADALEADRFVVFAMLDEDGAPDEYRRPPVCLIATLAKVVRSIRIPDGRYNIVVEGHGRVKIERELAPLPRIPYRRVQTVEIADRPCDDSAALTAAMLNLHVLSARIIAEEEDADDGLIDRINEIDDPAALSDIVAAATIRDPVDRQKILAEPGVLERLHLVAGALGTIALMATNRTPSWGPGTGEA